MSGHSRTPFIRIPEHFNHNTSYQLFSCLSHSEFRIAEYATRKSVTINQGRFESHTETIDDDSTIVVRIERERLKE